jgi:hypothetical protein
MNFIQLLTTGADYPEIRAAAMILPDHSSPGLPAMLMFIEKRKHVEALCNTSTIS